MLLVYIVYKLHTYFIYYSILYHTRLLVLVNHVLGIPRDLTWLLAMEVLD